MYIIDLYTDYKHGNVHYSKLTKIEYEKRRLKSNKSCIRTSKLPSYFKNGCFYQEILSSPYLSRFANETQYKFFPQFVLTK